MDTSFFTRLKSRLSSWPAIASAILLTQAIVSLTLKESTGWVSTMNFMLLFLLFLATGVAAVNALRSTQTVRLFWASVAGACGLWLFIPLLWIYGVLILGASETDVWLSTFLLFLHIILLIAAVASSPHLKSPSQKPYRATLNFLLLLLFWVFVYAYFMYPTRHGTGTSTVILRFEAFYFPENLLLLAALGMLIHRTEAPWRTIYWHLFGASCLYALGSLAGNIRFAVKGSTGAPVHIPYLASACWFVWVALQGRKLLPQLAQTVRLDDRETKYSSVFAMLAVVTVPLVGIWDLLRGGEPAEIRVARLLIVLGFSVLLAVVLFVRENLANRELSSDAVMANDRLRLAMESGKTVAWDWDVKSGRDAWFGDLQTMFGIPEDTYLGKVDDFRRRVHPEDRELVWRAVQEARLGQKPYRAEFRVVWPDGTVRWATATGKFYYAANGDPVRMLGIAQDITDRKQIEEKLRESQERLTGIVVSAMDAIIAVDGEQRIVVFNAAAERMFACAAEDAIGAALERFIPQRFRTAHRDHLRQFGNTGGSGRAMGPLGPLWALRANGEEFPIEASISHLETGGKKLFTVILRDITERKCAEEALRESEERFRLVANTAPVMIWMTAPDKLCNYFNRPWLEFTGRSLEAELGNGWEERVHPEDLKSCLETYTQAFARRELFRMEYRLKRHDGEYRWVLNTGVPRFIEGSFAGYIGSCIDVTDHKLAEEALSGLSRKLMEAHEEERTRIARELHDDVGQRMAMLTIKLERLGQLPPSASAEMRSRVQELCQRMMDLGKDIQAISHRLHSSKLEYLGIAAAAAGFCTELSEQQHVEIDFSHEGIPEDLPLEVALCLFRVLQEALRNAVKHSGVRHFTVALRGDGDEVQLEVSDAGTGFRPETAMKSHGLGLISMQERLSLVKGAISIESQPGSGTRISARVPLRSENGLSEAVG